MNWLAISAVIKESFWGAMLVGTEETGIKMTLVGVKSMQGKWGLCVKSQERF